MLKSLNLPCDAGAINEDAVEVDDVDNEAKLKTPKVTNTETNDSFTKTKAQIELTAPMDSSTHFISVGMR